MSAFGLELAIASLVLGGAGIAQGQVAQRQTRKARRAQQRAQAAQAKKDIVQQVRQRRIAEGQVLASSAAQGTQYSSSARGGMAAIGSSMAGNIQTIGQNLQFSNQIAAYQESALRSQQNAQALTSLANLGLRGAGMMGNTPSQPTKTVSSVNTTSGLNNALQYNANPLQFQSGKI